MYLQIPGTKVRLLGSIHGFPETTPDLPGWVRDAYEWSEALAFETDNSTVIPFFKSAEITNLQSLLEVEVWSVLASIWPAEGPLSPLSSVHPWAALLLAPSFCQRTLPGVEPRLARWAYQHSKPITFLETAKEFAAAFEAVPIEEALAGLKLLASDLSEPLKTLNEIHAAWLSKDLAAVYAAAARSPIFSYPGLRSAVLESRNRAWVFAVQEILKTEKRTLIVVGALHLHGPNNLIQLLGRKTELVQTAD